MLFGLSLAVTGFNRFPVFLQAVVRRFTGVLVSMYFDDATIQDFQSARGSGQMALVSIAEALGAPLAADKRQQPSSQGSFLGLDHDLAQGFQYITFWPRLRLIQKVQGYLEQILQERKLLPGLAAKLYGCLNFLDHGAFGKIARAGLNAIKERQTAKAGPFTLTSEIKVAIEVICALLKLQPSRVVPSACATVPRFLAASDAAYEESKGSGGYLVQLLPASKIGGVVAINKSVLALWDAEVMIAQLELLMILQGLIDNPTTFRGASGIWFVDNIASLMALVRGRSRNHDLDRMAHMIHALMFTLQCTCYFEWVESKSNWSDSLSRDGFADLWIKDRGFQVFPSQVVLWLWSFPVGVLVQVFSYI
jgi:hypothetical protein